MKGTTGSVYYGHKLRLVIAPTRLSPVEKFSRWYNGLPVGTIKVFCIAVIAAVAFAVVVTL